MKQRKLIISRLFVIIFLSCMLLIVFCYTRPSISRPQNLYNGFTDNLYDGNGILEGALKYIATKPKYKSRYYKTGYSDDKYGVCTDVIAMAMKSIGYDLMYLVNEDIKKNPIDYKITKPDINI